MEKNYIPGVCNIGPSEIRRRMWVGWGGLIVTVVLGIFLYALQVAPPVRLIIFIPAFAAAMGFLQAYMHFCVAFGTKGLFNMDKAAGITESVDKAEFRRKDQRKVVFIYIYALIIALLVAFAVFFF